MGSGREFDDIFDVVWNGGPLLPPRDQKQAVLGGFAIERTPPAPRSAAPPAPRLDPTKRREASDRMRAKQAENRAEWQRLFEANAPKACVCGCGTPLTQRSVSLVLARRGRWSCYARGHHQKRLARVMSQRSNCDIVHDGGDNDGHKDD